MTTEIRLLPINSFELEGHLTKLGSSLLQFGNTYNFSKRCMDVDDCDFLQSVVIEFTSEFKADFIAYYGVHNSSIQYSTPVIIRAEELPENIKNEAAYHAKERKLNVVSPRLTGLFQLKYSLKSFLNYFKALLYTKRSNYRNRKIKPVKIPSPSPGKFRLLMSTYHRNTIFTLTPLQDRLKNRQDVTQLYIANRYETYKRLCDLGYPGIISGWSIRTPDKVRVNDNVLISFLDEYFQFHFPFGKATKLFRKRFYVKLKQKLLFLTELYMPMKRILADYQPDILLVSSCSTSDSQLLIHLCKSQSIRVIEMTHGMFQDTPLLEFQNVPVKLVWCDRQRDLMKKYKPSVDCPVIGNPKHDELMEKFANNPPIRTINKPYVLFASTPGNNISISWSTYIKILEQYIEVARIFPELFFVIKLHPSEDLEKIKLAAKVAGAPSNFNIVQAQNVYELLYHAEIVLVLTSTVGFEALLWKKKIICYSIPNSDKWLPFAEYNLAKSASNQEELINCIDYFLNHDSLVIGNSNRDYFVFSDGRAIDNMLSLTMQPKVELC